MEAARKTSDMDRLAESESFTKLQAAVLKRARKAFPRLDLIDLKSAVGFGMFNALREFIRKDIEHYPDFGLKDAFSRTRQEHYALLLVSARKRHDHQGFYLRFQGFFFG